MIYWTRKKNKNRQIGRFFIYIAFSYSLAKVLYILYVAKRKRQVLKQEIIKFINKKYNADPEYLWRRYPTYCVFRHAGNKKWFALIGTVPRSILKLTGDGEVDFINVKTSDIEFFRGVKGILPAYHMNKSHWITVLLDGTLPLKNIQHLIEMSYELTA